MLAVSHRLTHGQLQIPTVQSRVNITLGQILEPQQEVHQLPSAALLAEYASQNRLPWKGYVRNYEQGQKSPTILATYAMAHLIYKDQGQKWHGFTITDPLYFLSPMAHYIGDGKAAGGTR